MSSRAYTVITLYKASILHTAHDIVFYQSNQFRHIMSKLQSTDNKNTPSVLYCRLPYITEKYVCFTWIVFVYLWEFPLVGVLLLIIFSVLRSNAWSSFKDSCNSSYKDLFRLELSEYSIFYYERFLCIFHFQQQLFNIYNLSSLIALHK